MTMAALGSRQQSRLVGAQWLLMVTGLLIKFLYFFLKTYLQQEAAPDPCSNQEKVTRGLEQGKCHIDTTATKRAGEGERSEKQCLFHHKMSFEQPTVALDIIALQNLLVNTSRLFLELIIISDYYQ